MLGGPYIPGVPPTDWKIQDEGSDNAFDLPASSQMMSKPYKHEEDEIHFRVIDQEPYFIPR